MITLISFVACILAMCGSFCVALGRLKAVYLIGIATGLSFITVNIVLAARGNGQEGVLWLCLPSIWGILMSLVGLRRLNKLKKGVKA